MKLLLKSVRNTVILKSNSSIYVRIYKEHSAQDNYLSVRYFVIHVYTNRTLAMKKIEFN